MRTPKQPVACLLLRGVLIAAVSACSLTAWAQSTSQGNAASPAKSSATPPPADLEPGVNTSATQTSSAEPVATPPPVSAPTPTPKPAQIPAKRVPASASGAAPSAATSAPNGASSPNAASAPNAANARAASGGTPKAGATAGKAHDSIELDTTQITGNRELPKVLYIVPWKRSDLGDLAGKPVNSLLDEVLTPVDRDVFKRQNRYYDALKPDEAKDAAGAAAGVNGKH